MKINREHNSKAPSARDSLLSLLSDKQWHDHTEMRVGGVRYSARVLELKRLGYDIASEGGKEGKRYKLVGRKSPQNKRVKVFLEEADVMRILAGVTPLRAGAKRELCRALDSYNANRTKL